MRTIYIAGKFSAQARLHRIRDEIRLMRHRVLSSWLEDNNTEEAATHCPRSSVERDLEEIRCSDLVIIDTLDESTTGGREFEIGYAEACGIEIWRVGPHRNVFHQLLLPFDSWAEVKEALKLEF